MAFRLFETSLDEPRLDALKDEYERLYEDGEANGAGKKYLKMFERYRQGLWRAAINRPSLFGAAVEGSVVLDFGCKFGQVTPVFMAMGAKQVVSVEVDADYLRDGTRFIAPRYGSRYVRSEDCHVDIESNSVDLVFANEVISHIHPGLLDTFYAEMARVMKPGGTMLIGDGNNLAHLPTRLELIENYRQWENGSSKELGSNYERQREKMLQKQFPDLGEDRLAYFARNTAGLHQQRLIETVRAALAGEPFIERPYRPGEVPVHPSYGVVMERAFHPIEVELALAAHGISAVQIREDESAQPIESERERGAARSFMIRGTKLAEDEDALKEFARERNAAGW